MVAASSAVRPRVSGKLGTAEILFQRAQQMGLAPIWVTPRGVFAITINGQERYINLARSPLNSDASAALAKNKHITRRILERHHMPNIPYVLPRTQADAEEFLRQHSTVVAKPVSGAAARDIHIITTPGQLASLTICRYLLEKYIPGTEVRYLVLNNEVVGVHRSEYGTSVSYDRPLTRISYPRSNWDPALVKCSLRIAGILSLRFAAVDYLIDALGQASILEVNTMPGLKWFHAPSSGPVVDVASLFLHSIVDDLNADQRLSSTPVPAVPARGYSDRAELSV